VTALVALVLALAAPPHDSAHGRALLDSALDALGGAKPDYGCRTDRELCP
jgi:hypothetical protein